MIKFFYFNVFSFLGLEKYWEDNWNKFDFIMIIFSIASQILFQILSFLKSFKSAKAGRILKITKINRVFRVFKALRSVKFLKIFFEGIDTFN